MRTRKLSGKVPKVRRTRREYRLGDWPSPRLYMNVPTGPSTTQGHMLLIEHFGRSKFRALCADGWASKETYSTVAKAERMWRAHARTAKGLDRPIGIARALEAVPAPA